MKTKRPPAFPIEKLRVGRTRGLTGPASLKKEVQHLPDGVIVLDQEYAILYVNSPALMILGCKESDLVGEPFDLVEIQDTLFDAPVRYFVGQSKFVELRATRIMRGAEELVFITLQDITERVGSEERLNLAIEATGLGLWDYDYSTNVTSVNHYYATMLGYTIEEFDSSTWVHLLHPVDQKNVWDKWNKHIDGVIPFYYCIYRICTRSGKWKWIQARGKIKGRDEKGNPLHYIGTHQDITRQKQTERELKLLYQITSISSEFSELSQKMEHALEKTILLFEADKGLIHILDMDEHELRLISSKGLSQHLISRLGNLTLQDSTWKTAMKSQEPAVISYKDQNSKDSILSVLETSLTAGFPINLNGKCVGVLTICWDDEQPFTDLDEYLLGIAADQIALMFEHNKLRKNADAVVVMRERQRLARELHDSLSQSLYSLSLIADGGRDFAKLGDIPQVKKVFEQIIVTVQKVIREMRLLVYELRPSALAKEGLFGALRRRLEIVEEHANIETHLEYQLIDTLPKSLEAELYGIVQEALNNALKHSGAGRVEITVCQEGDKVVLKVDDNGQGFDLKNEMTFPHGMGLASMMERAERINGTVIINTAAGEGTQVIVSSPT